jgi:hypothetical protein
MSLAPKTEEEATLLCVELAEKFGFQVIILQTEDIKDLMGTEKWQENDFKNALHLATEEVADSVGDAIINAVDEQNKNIRNFLKRISTNPKQKLK